MVTKTETEIRALKPKPESGRKNGLGNKGIDIIKDVLAYEYALELGLKINYVRPDQR
ncbi:MAG: hypothetical protein AABX82_07305 [Nanoarchaeota archaeon]